MRRQRAPKGAEGRRRRSLWPPVSALGAGLLASPSLATLPRSRTQADRDCRLRALRGAHRAPRPGGAGELPGRVARAGWPLPPPPCAAARPTAHLRGRELRAGTWAGACVCTCPVGFSIWLPRARDAVSRNRDASCVTRALCPWQWWTAASSACRSSCSPACLRTSFSSCVPARMPAGAIDKSRVVRRWRSWLVLSLS